MKQLTTGSGIGSMISAAKKRLTPPHVIGHLAAHEASHERADIEGPGEFGLLIITAIQYIPVILNNRIEKLKKQRELVVGAFYRWIGERSAKVRKAIASAPPDMSDQDKFIESIADQDIKKEEYAAWLQQKFEESETDTLDDQNFSQEENDFNVEQSKWHTTSTQDFETDDQDADQPTEIPLPLSEEQNTPQIDQEDTEHQLINLYHQFLLGEPIAPEKWEQLKQSEKLTEEIIHSFYEPSADSSRESKQEKIDQLADNFFSLVLIKHLAQTSAESS